MRTFQTIADRFDYDVMLEVYEEIEVEITVDVETALRAKIEEPAGKRKDADENDNLPGRTQK